MSLAIPTPEQKELEREARNILDLLKVGRRRRREVGVRYTQTQLRQRLAWISQELMRLAAER